MSSQKETAFRRVTFSFPTAVLDELRMKIGKNCISNYVAKVVKKDLADKINLSEDSEEFMKSLKKLAEENIKHIKTKKSSLQILRDIRSGKHR